MTKEQFEQANLIKRQIASIDDLLNMLKKASLYRLDPPTRQTCFSLIDCYNSVKCERDLTEAEVVCIKDALESRKCVLERNFEKL